MDVPKNYDPTKYWQPSLTTDVVLIADDQEEKKHVLLIKRKNPPFQECWAFPGGFLDKGETLKQCAVRELEEETGVRIAQDDLQFLVLADDPDRDPRKRVISSVYIAQGRMKDFTPRAADDASDVSWFPLEDPPPLAFDHPMILGKARDFLNKP